MSLTHSAITEVYTKHCGTPGKGLVFACRSQGRLLSCAAFSIARGEPEVGVEGSVKD